MAFQTSFSLKAPSFLIGLFAWLFLGLVTPVAAQAPPDAPTPRQAARETLAGPNTVASDVPTSMPWPAPDTGMAMNGSERPRTPLGRTLAWLGAWHPAVIHFPIALLLTAALLEVAAVVRRQPAYAAGNKLLLGIAMAAAFIAALLGWANAGLPEPVDAAALTTHRWLGTVFPFVLFGLWLLKRPTDEAVRRPASRLYELVLVIAVGLVLTQAFLGGEVTHGANHMRF